MFLRNASNSFSRIWLDQAGRQLQDQRFSGSAFSNQNFSFPGSYGEGQAIEHVAFVETNADVFEGENRLAGCGRAHSERMRPRRRATGGTFILAIIDGKRPPCGDDCYNGNHDQGTRRGCRQGTTLTWSGKNWRSV